MSYLSWILTGLKQDPAAFQGIVDRNPSALGPTTARLLKNRLLLSDETHHHTTDFSEQGYKKLDKLDSDGEDSYSDGGDLSDDDLNLAIKLSLEQSQLEQQQRSKMDQWELRESHFEDSHYPKRSAARVVPVKRAPSPPPPILLKSSLSTSPTKRMEFQKQFIDGVKDEEDEVHLVLRRKNQKSQAASRQPQSQSQAPSPSGITSAKPSTQPIYSSFPPEPSPNDPSDMMLRVTKSGVNAANNNNASSSSNGPSTSSSSSSPSNTNRKSGNFSSWWTKSSA